MVLLTHPQELSLIGTSYRGIAEVLPALSCDQRNCLQLRCSCSDTNLKLDKDKTIT